MYKYLKESNIPKITEEAQSLLYNLIPGLVTGLLDPVDILIFFSPFLRRLHNIPIV